MTHPLDVHDGYLHLSDRPGLGTDLIEAEIEKHPGIRDVRNTKGIYV